ncbi:probable RNA-binding protein 46 isoform X1 [Lates japonicus]|uniref:Probable RNA-binding protein 46 isoform X1 n=1 Tax=Lates japonicus TaxID=270547 RepID=A0AAD3MDT9_LATJO|nr:probable RNA-binding protein 46 isoform X1 [Lates japonicus]
MKQNCNRRHRVVIPCTRSTYMPDKLCVLLDDAKELAAQTTLWNLDSSLMSGASCDSPSSSSPLLAIPPSASPGVLTCSGRTSCLPPCALPSPFPLSPLSSLSTLTHLTNMFMNTWVPL